MTASAELHVAQIPLLPQRLKILRHAPWLAWLNNRMAYVVGTPILAIMGVGTTLVAPRLLPPNAFGTYALLMTIYLCAGRTDLGLTQLADRQIATASGDTRDIASALLRARYRLGALALATLLPIAFLGSWLIGRIAPVDVVLAVAAGVAAMVAGGPPSVFRAQRRVWEFTALALTLQFGFAVPRLAGLLIGGATGCFIALLVWYGAAWIAFSPRAKSHGPAPPLIGTVRTAFPLFVFSALWVVYLSANRWLSAMVSTPRDLGLFALGANLSFAALTSVALMAEIRYPHWLARLGTNASDASSSQLERELSLVSFATGVLVAIVTPFAQSGIAIAFPAYVAGSASTVGMAAACIPLAAVAWSLPIAIAMSPNPRRDAVMMFGPSLFALSIGMFFGNLYGGITGQAWGCCFAALVTSAAFLLSLDRAGALCRRSAVRVLILQIVVVAAVATVAVIFGPRIANAASTTYTRQEGPPLGWGLVFEDKFSTLSLWSRNGGTWEPHYPWGGRTNPTSGEMEFYVDPRPGVDSIALVSLAPFSTTAGHLAIAGRPIPTATRPAALGKSFASGLLTTARSVSFTYGYVEMRARVPAGKGLWPAFWLLPTDRTWPPEIDVMEVLGDDVSGYWATIHTKDGAPDRAIQAHVATPDLSSSMHDYAIRWTPEDVTWFFDGRRVASAPTPSDLHRPMYLLVNLAIGGKWPGTPDQATAFPARFEIERIRIYQDPLDPRQRLEDHRASNK